VFFDYKKNLAHETHEITRKKKKLFCREKDPAEKVSLPIGKELQECCAYWSFQQ